MYRDICGGGKGGGGSSYDPQIGKAAKMSAQVAADAQAWTQKYYAEVITPLLQQQSAASMDSQEKLGKLYDINAEQMNLAHERYKQYGIPAEERYYKMVDQYSEPEEFERQATAAKGDVGQAIANQQGTMMRKLSSLGIDPTSPGAVSAMGDMALGGAALEAAAMNRARNGARQLGMQLTADAANFGRGGQSGILQFGAGAQGNATGAFGIANQALGTGMQAGNGVLAGYNTAMQGYNNIMDNYAKLGAADIQANAQSSDPFGSLMGGAFGMLMGGAKPWIFSDRRLKENLVPIGKLNNGITVYIFNYKGSSARHIGVIAQEVRDVMPRAVKSDGRGFLKVNYDMLREAVDA